MKIYFSKDFVKNFKKRILQNSAVEKKYKERVEIFIKNRKYPILKDHKLIGKKKDFRSFSITGDIRVIYTRESKDTFIFIDIGTHNQVYS